MTQTKTDESRLVIRRLLNAKPEEVFDAWTNPKQLMKWWHSGDKMRPSLAEVDLREGGKYRLGMAQKDSGKEFVCYGVYKEIVRPHKIVYTWAWEEEGDYGLETLVTVEFKKADSGCELVLTHEKFVSAEVRDEHNKGWVACLDELAKTA